MNSEQTCANLSSERGDASSVNAAPLFVVRKLIGKSPAQVRESDRVIKEHTNHPPLADIFQYYSGEENIHINKL